MINISFVLSYIQAYFILANILSFLLYGYDKLKSLKNNRNTRRVSENKLLFSSLIGGTLGSIVSMIIFRHKIKKASFLIKLSLVVVFQVIVVYLYIKGTI